MASTLLLVAVIVGCLLVLWISHRIEPHWVSRDGERLICFGQGITRDGKSSGRWREMRISLVDNSSVEVRPRRGSLAVDRPGSGILTIAGGGRRRHVRRATVWKVAGQVDSTVKNRVMYLLDGNHDLDMPAMIAIRLPAKSKALPMLESIAVRRSQNASPPSRGTTQSADRPGRG